MTAIATELVAGPIEAFYIGAFQAIEPADSAYNSAPATSSWTDLGGTNDGLSVITNMELFKLTVDQVVWVPGRRVTEIDVQIKTALAQPTLENYKYALNSTGTISSGSGYKTYDPAITTASIQPTYVALIVDGWAPASTAGVAKRRRAILRKCMQIDNIESAYKKDGQLLIPVTWAAHYVSDAVTPFHIVDAT